MVEPDRERDRAAHRVPDDERAVEFQRSDHFGHDLSLRAEAGVGGGGAGRIARSGTIDRDDPELIRETVDERVGEIPQLAAEAVDQEQRRARALVDVVDALTIELEEAPAGGERRSRPVGRYRR